MGATFRPGCGVPAGVELDTQAPDRPTAAGPPPAPRSRSSTLPEFESFVAARSAALFGTALLLTGDRHLAEDLLQTALAKSWLSWHRIAGADPEAYVRRVLVNTYISMWRRRWNGETPTEELPETAAATPSGDPGARHDLRVAVRRLPKRQRAVVVLRYFEDLSEREVADLLGCSVGTVKSQASRALAKLAADTMLQEDPR